MVARFLTNPVIEDATVRIDELVADDAPGRRRRLPRVELRARRRRGRPAASAARPSCCGTATRTTRRRRRRGDPRRLRPRRLPALRRHRPLLARSWTPSRDFAAAGGTGASASATASRCSPRPACCRARSRRTAASSSSARRSSVRVESTDSVLTGAADAGAVLRIPINHFEGNYTVDADTLARLRDEDRIVLRYVENPNGSVDDIAGVCNEGRNVVGLMPHPERACHELLGSTDGAALLLGGSGRACGRPRRSTIHVRAPIAPPSTAAGPPRPRADRRRVRPRSPGSSGRAAQPPRAGDVLGDVVGALLLQVEPHPPPPAPDRGAPRAGRARRGRRASSTSATASAPPSASRATTTPRPSSPTRARPPASAASSATSSRWAPARSPRWTRSGSGPSTTPAAAGSPRASSSGVSGYGNAVGVPTVGGEVVFDETYAENPLVNVLCLGLLPVERLVLARASGVGNLAVLLGSSHRPRRHRRGVGAGVGRLRRGRGRRGQAPERAGRRPVRGEAPHRGLPRAARPRPRRRRAGPRRPPASPARRRETASKAGSGLDVYLSEVPAARAGHGALRGA